MKRKKEGGKEQGDGAAIIGRLLSKGLSGGDI